MKILSSVVLALVCSAVAAGSAAAQLPSPGLGAEQSGTRGLTIGLNLNGGAIDSRINDSAWERGLGAGLTLGYGVSGALALFLRGTYAYELTQVDLGARYGFGGSAARVRPYLEGALSRTSTSEVGHRLVGPALTGGAGVEYLLSRNLALDVGLTYSRGSFNRAQRAGEPADLREGFTASRVNVGVKWRP